MKLASLAATLLFCSVFATSANGQGFPFPLPPNGGGGIGGGFELSIEDTTTELGVSFDLVISVAADDVAMQGGFNLSVEPTELFTEGWTPGAGLQSYLDANGPIGCDESNTGSNLNVFFFFNAPYDAAVHGTELARVQCLAIAQAEGTTTATLTDTFGLSTDTAVVTFLGGTAIDPSQIPQPPTPPLPPFPMPPFPVSEFDYSIGDVTTELGVSFELVISVAADDVAMQAALSLVTEADDIFIEGWTPGAGLQSYLTANGPIGCDDSNTGSQLDAFFFFNAPYDAAVHGTEFLRVQCLAIAQAEGTSVVNLLDTFNFGNTTAEVTFLGGTPIDPADIPQPPQPPIIVIPPFPGGMDDAEYTIDDTVATIGAPLTLSIDATATDTIFIAAFDVACDSTQIAFTGFEPGAGLQAYIDDNGQIPCDVQITPESVVVFMLFMVPFDTALYGADFVNLTCDVITDTAGTTEVTLMNLIGQPTDPTIVTIIDPAEAFLRGDTNIDGVCNIADAVKVLEYLFGSGELSCMDAADTNDDGTLNIADPLSALESMFGTAGPAPETCAVDLSDDLLGCQQPGCE